MKRRYTVAFLFSAIFNMFLINSLGQGASVPGCGDEMLEKVKTALVHQPKDRHFS